MLLSVKLPNLKLKTRPKELLGFLLYISCSLTYLDVILQGAALTLDLMSALAIAFLIAPTRALMITPAMHIMTALR